MPNRVAVLGSSGGNLRSLGGDDPSALLGDIRRQLEAAGIELAEVQFVAAEGSMDNARQNTRASLWGLADGEVRVVAEGTLEDINSAASERDEAIAREIESGRLDGLILVSADPNGVNARAIEAAVARDLPAVGTGGTSIATAQSKGLNLVAASGTTGTTNRTRAVMYASALARHWGLTYRPIIGGTGEAVAGESPWRRISLRSIMVSSIPAFIAMAITLALSKIPGAAFMDDVFNTMLDALPVVVAAMAARKVSGLDEVGVIAGVVAGVLSIEGGILGGIVGGILAGILANQLLVLTLGRDFPATTANIVSGGLSGLVGGLVVFFGVAPITAAAGNGIRAAIEWAVDFNGVLAGALAGVLMWPAIIGGVYHSAILPVVLLEMEKQGNSFFGAIDMVGLVMVSAGITLANLIYPRTTGERALAASGFPVNVGFGTFVEASYPFMFADKLVFGGALLSACVGGAVAGLFEVRGTAYVPAVVAPFVSNNPLGLVAAMLTSSTLALLITLGANWRARRGAREQLRTAPSAEKATAAPEAATQEG
jgi:fructose-specific phosphotransferase system IIC component